MEPEKEIPYFDSDSLGHCENIKMQVLHSVLGEKKTLNRILASISVIQYCKTNQCFSSFIWHFKDI